MGFLATLFSGSLTAAIITYFFGGGAEVFFGTAFISCVLIDVFFNKRDED